MPKDNFGAMIHTARQDAIKATKQALHYMRQTGNKHKQGFVYIVFNFTDEPNRLLYFWCKKNEPILIHKQGQILFSNPGKYVGKDQRIFNAGGEAFAERMRSYGFICEVLGRTDLTYI